MDQTFVEKTPAQLNTTRINKDAVFRKKCEYVNISHEICENVNISTMVVRLTKLCTENFWSYPQRTAIHTISQTEQHFI